MYKIRYLLQNTSFFMLNSNCSVLPSDPPLCFYNYRTHSLCGDRWSPYVHISYISLLQRKIYRIQCMDNGRKHSVSDFWKLQQIFL